MGGIGVALRGKNHGFCKPFGISALAPLSYLLWPLCLIPALATLSFPPVVSGNPVSFSSVPSFVWPLHGNSHGFPIENVGNDRGRLRRSGMTWAESVWPCVGKTTDSASLLSCLLWPLCHTCSAPFVSFPLCPLCHSRRLLAGIQCLSLLSLHLCGPAWEQPWIPD